VILVPRAESIYVLGQVRTPGAIPLEKDVTVMQALAWPEVSPSAAP
jgi:protein involved in polysaccharide export with SLBB domain